MAVIAGARIVTVGAVDMAPADGETAAATAALAEAGVTVESRVIVEEDETSLEHALAGDAALTVITAGPGGSAADIVRRVLGRVTGTRLVLNERMLAALEEIHRRQDRPLPRRAERLALLPEGAKVWAATTGEPAWLLDGPRAAFVVIPRAGRLDAAVAERLLAFARARVAGRGATATRTLRTVGVPASDLEDRLADWLGKDPEVSVVTAPADGEVWVRLRARGATVEQARDALAAVEPGVRAVLGDDCYARDAETLEQAVGRLLVARGMSLAVAESCTGGLLGHRITSIAGSSAYFERGVIVYSNLAKQQLLGVPEAVLRAHGAVSAQCAEAMAQGICTVAHSDCGLAVTGIAGPDGGTPTKPVGTVFIGVAVNGDVMSRGFRFSGDRAAVKWQSSQMALDMLRRRVGGSSP
jgi:competence/damage-inducible protein CinA-like protein